MKAAVVAVTRTSFTKQTVSRISSADNISYNLSAVKSDANGHEASFRFFWVHMDAVGRFDSINCELSDSLHMAVGLVLDHWARVDGTVGKVLKVGVSQRKSNETKVASRNLLTI